MSLEQLLAEMETLAQLLLFQLADTEVKKNFTDQDKAALIEARNHLRLAYNRANGKWAGGETSDVRKIKEILSGVLSNESSSAILATVINHKPAHQSMVVIRLSRVGKNKFPSYRIVVSDRRKDPWGDYLENVGFYNPLEKPKKIEFKRERVEHWLSKGAQPSATVYNLLVDAGVVKAGKRKATRGKKGSKAVVAGQKTGAPAAPVPVAA